MSCIVPSEKTGRQYFFENPIAYRFHIDYSMNLPANGKHFPEA